MSGSIIVKVDGALWAWGYIDPRIELKDRLYRAGMFETLILLSPDFGVN